MSHPPSSIQRFSSRAGRLSHVFLKDRLAGAKSYRRIAGYFRSSIFELVEEEIAGIDSIEIVCNSDLDPRDITASRLARETALKEKWNEGFDEIDRRQVDRRYREYAGVFLAVYAEEASGECFRFAVWQDGMPEGPGWELCEKVLAAGCSGAVVGGLVGGIR